MNFYFDAAQVLDRIDAKHGSIKGIIGSLPGKDRKRTAALVIETLKYKAVLLEVIEAANLLKQERQKITSANLALLLVHDFLLARGIQAGDGPIKQAILRHKTRLHAEFTKMKIRRGVTSNIELAQDGDPRARLIPRYVRVNRNVWTMEEAVEYFVSVGFEQSGDPIESRKSFSIDEHIPDLLLFHPTVQFHEDESYKTGKIILQDKASCFSAAVLAPPAKDNCVVIDATAAPGNKTSHLSALMHNRGKIYAFERDRRRFRTLQHMTTTARCTNVEPLNADFLLAESTDPKYERVTHILLDPSCSGSGIVNRLDHLQDYDENEDGQEERLNKLAAFQLSMILHAMTFPSVTNIVYSTCSVHAAENEEVVSLALSSDEASGKFILARREDVLPSWPRRGLKEKMLEPTDAESVIRCTPGEDHTNGFFVSSFIKVSSTPLKIAINSTSDIQSDSFYMKKRQREVMDRHGGDARIRRPRKRKK
ncbi:williams-Beuren syndrome critical region protein 20 copy A [Rickenella mellea]|uniref:Williams-Beuren syndrome critical region protein 20 copy A n=1 Tax=Rickenella mellea TaxID=50990 RepID=A0A4Y7QD54_9AGAM|nr:williams-Beuren syndrome critical region protein 20 copy A [Rickenella mellea]